MWRATLWRVFTALGLLASSCASTKVVSKWADPEYAAGPIRRALVIGVSSNARVRREFEDAFVSQLEARGVVALPSYRVLPDAGNISVETVEPIVQEHDVTHVLVTRLVDQETVRTHVPATVSTSYAAPYPSYYYGWYSYYSASYSTVVSPGYTYETDYVHLETNVYDVLSAKLVWSGLTETELRSGSGSQTQELIALITRELQHDKLL